MSAAHVRRGGNAKARPAAKKRARKSAPASHVRISRAAGLVFGAFVLAIGLVSLVALDIPAKAARATGVAIGRAGFIVDGYQIVGINHMDRKLVDAVVTDELRRAAEESDGDKPAQPLVDVSAIRQRLLQFGWVKDARVSRRLPDTLVIDIVERTPAALWQDKGQLALIDAEGVVLDRVPVDKMPDLPLLIGAGANRQEEQLARLLADVPTLKPQLASATWVGGRRWDLNFQSGETVALPEGDELARSALVKFAKLDRSTGLLGRDFVRFDLRIPGKMVARPRHPPAAGDAPQTPQES